jgi:hypothetical protein
LYLNPNAYLKSRGVKAVFDVSFGAELTVYSYIKYIDERKPYVPGEARTAKCPFWWTALTARRAATAEPESAEIRRKGFL